MTSRRLAWGLAVMLAMVVAFAVGVRAADSARGAAWLRFVVKTRFQAAGPAAVRKAFCIVGRESEWKPWAVNPASGSMGLFQIMPSVHTQFRRDLLLNAEYNTWAAWVLSRHGREWGPWNGGRWPC